MKRSIFTFLLLTPLLFFIALTTHAQIDKYQIPKDATLQDGLLILKKIGSDRAVNGEVAYVYTPTSGWVLLGENVGTSVVAVGLDKYLGAANTTGGQIYTVHSHPASTGLTTPLPPSTQDLYVAAKRKTDYPNAQITSVVAEARGMWSYTLPSSVAKEILRQKVEFSNTNPPDYLNIKMNGYESTLQAAIKEANSKNVDVAQIAIEYLLRGDFGSENQKRMQEILNVELPDNFFAAHDIMLYRFRAGQISLEEYVAFFRSRGVDLYLSSPTQDPATNKDSFLVPLINQDGTVEAGRGFVPCSGVTCSPCDLVVLFNTVLKWFMTMAFLLFAVLAILAGFKLISSGGNSGALKEAKGSFTNAFIGLLIILSAWLIVDTLLRKLLPSGNGEISGYGPWSSVQCATQVVADTSGRFEGDILFEPASYYQNVPISSNVPSGNIQQRIASAALAYKGSPTASGPGGGNVACAWAVNNVLRNAKVGTVDGDSVIDMEKVLVQGRGARINQSQAVPGDLVILLQARTSSGKVGNHVGICLNTGCTQVISNSSSKKTFSWVSGSTFSPSYTGGTPRFYRVTN